MDRGCFVFLCVDKGSGTASRKDTSQVLHSFAVEGRREETSRERWDRYRGYLLISSWLPAVRTCKLNGFCLTMESIFPPFSSQNNYQFIHLNIYRIISLPDLLILVLRLSLIQSSQQPSHVSFYSELHTFDLKDKFLIIFTTSS